MFHVGESELVKGVRVSSHFIIRTEISPSLAWPGFGALPLPWSVLLPTKSHPGSFRCQDGPCISSGFSTNRQASKFTQMDATSFLRANTPHPTTKTFAVFCQSNDATSRPPQDCRNCESSMASNPHPITPSVGTTTNTRNRRPQHIQTRLDGGHKPPSHPTAASQPPPPPPRIINERNHQRILRQKKKKRKMTTSFTPSNQPCRTLGRPS